MGITKKHQRNKRKNNKASPIEDVIRNPVGRPGKDKSEKIKPNGIPNKMWNDLTDLLQAEEVVHVASLVRRVLNIYFNNRLQMEAKIQNIAPSELLERSVEWYLNSRRKEESI